MSGKCPENVQNNNIQIPDTIYCLENVQNNNIQIPDTIYCLENVPKCDHFQHLEFVRNLSKSGICPEN